MSHKYQVYVAGVFLCLLPLRSSIAAEDAPFEPGETVRLAVRQMEKYHVTKTQLDDTLSRKWLRAFLDRVDPRRMYFLELDLQEFRRFEDRLDDLAKKADFGFPRLVRDRYRKRIKTAVGYAEEFLSTEHDYTRDEEFPKHFAGYAADPETLRERWRLRMKAELLIEKLHGRQRSDVKSQLAGRYQRIEKQARDMTDERLCQVYLDSLASLYDPRSSYLSPTFVSSFNQTITPCTFSLGLDLRKCAGEFEITAVDSSFVNPNMQKKLIGWHLLAICQIDGLQHDLVEMHREDLRDLIHSSFGPLQCETEIILELMNPITYERETVSWCRLSWCRF